MLLPMSQWGPVLQSEMGDADRCAVYKFISVKTTDHVVLDRRTISRWHQGRNTCTTCAGSDKPIRGHYVIRTPYNQVRLIVRKIWHSLLCGWIKKVSRKQNEIHVQLFEECTPSKVIIHVWVGSGSIPLSFSVFYPVCFRLSSFYFQLCLPFSSQSQMSFKIQ